MLQQRCLTAITEGSTALPAQDKLWNPRVISTVGAYPKNVKINPVTDGCTVSLAVI